MRVEWVKGADGRVQMQEIADSGFDLQADLVLLAMGFVHPRHNGLVEQSGVALDPRRNVKANTADYKTSVQKIFACGECGAASRWWSGRSARAGRRRARWTSS